MLIARNAAITLALLSATLVAQQAPTAHLTIKVTDRTGAVIPGARIQIDRTSWQSKIAATTDPNGQASIDLPQGNHAIAISAQGFETSTRQFDVQQGSGQSIVAVLEIGQVSGPPIVAPWPDFPLERPPFTTFIPLRPLQNLAPLPAVKASRSGLFHRNQSKSKPSQTL